MRSPNLLSSIRKASLFRTSEIRVWNPDIMSTAGDTVMVRSPLATQIKPPPVHTAQLRGLAVARDYPGKGQHFESFLQRVGRAGAEGGEVN